MTMLSTADGLLVWPDGVCANVLLPHGGCAAELRAITVGTAVELGVLGPLALEPALLLRGGHVVPLLHGQALPAAPHRDEGFVLAVSHCQVAQAGGGVNRNLVHGLPNLLWLQHRPLHCVAVVPRLGCLASVQLRAACMPQCLLCRCHGS